MTPMLQWQKVMHWAGELIMLGGLAWGMYLRLVVDT